MNYLNPQKLRVITLLFVSVLFFLNTTTAQAPSAVPAQYRADYTRIMNDHSMNLQTQRMMDFMRFMNRNNQSAYINLKFQFTVVMKDSSVKFTKSKIYFDTNTHKCYLEYTDKSLSKKDTSREQKIYPEQTVMIMRDDNQLNKHVLGYANDTCWLFKVIEGKINAYSFLSLADEYNYALSALQVGDEGELQPFNLDRLEALIKENEKAYKLFKKKYYFDAIVKYNKGR